MPHRKLVPLAQEGTVRVAEEAVTRETVFIPQLAPPGSIAGVVKGTHDCDEFLFWLNHHGF
jgi:hypothetical protein